MFLLKHPYIVDFVSIVIAIAYPNGIASCLKQYSVLLRMWTPKSHVTTDIHVDW